MRGVGEARRTAKVSECVPDVSVMLSALLLSGPLTAGVSTTASVETDALSKNRRSVDVKFDASVAVIVSKT